MTSAMNAVVTVKSIKVFGDSTKYPADEVTIDEEVRQVGNGDEGRASSPPNVERAAASAGPVHYY